MQAYHIKQWDGLYETADTRKIRTLTYYAKPNKLIGEGVGHTLAQDDGLSLLGTWALLEALASTAPQEYRGWLVRNGTPLDAARMASLVRISALHFERALTFFSCAPMDWLELIDWPGQSPGTPRNPAAHQNGTGTPPGQSPGTPQHSENHPETAGTILLRGSTDKRGKTDKEEEREKKRGFASVEEARRAQTQQFASAQARIRDLEAVGEEERTSDQEQDLKNMRRTVRQIQKKQAAGDFNPVTAGKP